jgi:hypothetical protein
MTDHDPQREARDRQHDRAATVERVLESVDPAIDDRSYPANSVELAAAYRNTELDVVAETESFGDALDRVASEYDEFADAEEARAALTAELTRDELFDETFTDEPSSDR